MKKIGLTIMLLLFSLILLAGACFAATAAGTPGAETGVSQIVDGVVQPVLLSLIGVMVPLLVALACRFLAKLTGINISQASQQRLEGIAEKSVLAVEEKASASLKSAGEQWTGYQKHREAIDNIIALAPSLSHEQADLLVHWAIAKIPGLGSTGVLGATPGSTINITNATPGGINGVNAADPVGLAAAAAV